MCTDTFPCAVFLRYHDHNFMCGVPTLVWASKHIFICGVWTKFHVLVWLILSHSWIINLAQLVYPSVGLPDWAFALFDVNSQHLSIKKSVTFNCCMCIYFQSFVKSNIYRSFNIDCAKICWCINLLILTKPRFNQIKLLNYLVWFWLAKINGNLFIPDAGCTNLFYFLSTQIGNKIFPVIKRYYYCTSWDWAGPDFLILANLD